MGIDLRFLGIGGVGGVGGTGVPLKYSYHSLAYCNLSLKATTPALSLSYK